MLERGAISLPPLVAARFLSFARQLRNSAQRCQKVPPVGKARAYGTTSTSVIHCAAQAWPLRSWSTGQQTLFRHAQYCSRPSDHAASLRPQSSHTKTRKRLLLSDAEQPGENALRSLVHVAVSIDHRATVRACPPPTATPRPERQPISVVRNYAVA